MSNLTIVLFTYNRPEYARRTIHTTLANIDHDGQVNVHIADDGSPQEQIDEIIAQVHYDMTAHYLNGTITHSNAQRGGYGKSYNLAMQQTHSADYLLCLEDDWELTRTLYTEPIIKAMEADPMHFGCVRLGYLGHTQDLWGEVIYESGMNWLYLDPTSAEPHVFAGHPRLETVAWQKHLGVWPEYLEPGNTEFYVATQMPQSREGVVWPMDMVKSHGDLFVHIGTERSY